VTLDTVFVLYFRVFYIFFVFLHKDIVFSPEFFIRLSDLFETHQGDIFGWLEGQDEG